MRKILTKGVSILESRPTANLQLWYHLKHPVIREDLNVIQYQSQEADNIFITSDGTSPYNSTRKWTVKRHYREDND